jgi:hypothetical protein
MVAGATSSRTRARPSRSGAVGFYPAPAWWPAGATTDCHKIDRLAFEAVEQVTAQEA